MSSVDDCQEVLLAQAITRDGAGQKSRPLRRPARIELIEVGAPPGEKIVPFGPCADAVVCDVVN